MVLFTSREDEGEDAREMTLAWQGLVPVKWTLLLWLIIPPSCTSPYSYHSGKPELFVLSVKGLILFSRKLLIECRSSEGHYVPNNPQF